MENLKQYLSRPIFYLGLIGILLLSNVSTLGYFLLKQEKETPVVCEECPEPEVTEIAVVPEEEKKIMLKVDIKGYVKKPGVYEVEEGTIVNDLISLAGGLKSGGTTENINLSKRLNNEDMIVILSKSELNKLKVTTSSYNSQVTTSSNSSSTMNGIITNNNVTKKVSLNSATKEELMTLNGIGEAKALAILEYRTQKAFTDIKEIMNVSGIGESVYEKIKDNITI